MHTLPRNSSRVLSDSGNQLGAKLIAVTTQERSRRLDRARLPRPARTGSVSVSSSRAWPAPQSESRAPCSGAPDHMLQSPSNPEGLPMQVFDIYAAASATTVHSSTGNWHSCFVGRAGPMQRRPSGPGT